MMNKFFMTVSVIALVIEFMAADSLEGKPRMAMVKAIAPTIILTTSAIYYSESNRK